MKFESIVDFGLLKHLESLRLKISRTARTGISTIQTEVEEIIIIPERTELSNRVESRDNEIFDSPIIKETVHLVLRYAESMPIEEAEISAEYLDCPLYTIPDI